MNLKNKSLFLVHGSFFITIIILSSLAVKAQVTSALPQLGKSPVKNVIAAMTLEEKAKLVTGNGMKMPGNQQQGPVIGETRDKVPGAAGTTFAIPRLGVPGIVLSDGPAGVRIDPFRNNDSSRSYYATAFPVGTLLASSWDTAMVKKVGVAFGSEVHDYGIDVLLAPALNIHRNPLGGRNFEYYSEDPVVSGKIAAAMVNGIQSNGVGTSIKHFVANNQETNRNTVNTIVSERALREIYLKGFEITVKESQPWTVMSSYNKINGTYASHDYELLTTILRNEWGFKGLVMTDWFGGKDPVAQMNAGNDLLMPGTPAQSDAIIKAVNDGKLEVKVLDQNVERVLNLILKSPAFKQYKYADKPDLAKDALVSRSAAEEGMILLKNDNNALPLKQAKKVALFGNTSYDIIAGGTGSGDVNKAYVISLLQGLKNEGLQPDATLANEYSSYLAEEKRKHPKKGFFEEFMNPTPRAEELEPTQDIINKEAESNDIAVFTIGRNAGEGKDRKIENDFTLNDREKKVLKSVTDAFHAQHKKVVVVLNIGGVIDITEWRDNADAILLAWQPGLEAGNAIAALLDGKVNPSGKLATTFPSKYEDVSSAKNFPGKEFPEQAEQSSNPVFRQVPAEVTYEEGIYVGYRYYDKANVQPVYEFGYGLSYTNFVYNNLKLSSTQLNGKITASIDITNAGKTAGKEVVQLYIHAPGKTMDKPEKELKAFAKTKLLKPGEKQTISFTITPDDLASFDTEHTAWVTEAGTYEVIIGASSRNIKAKASFNVAKEIVTEKDHKILVPQVTIDELKF
ncbi:MAG: glycoside hydrolase family 3 C-terminal domain-containing protein [Bacteroidetes bacterium]|nr:glycoside hydrolase family 3 C-terminal domain-containing protein [Bacteroidota bacterium]